MNKTPTIAFALFAVLLLAACSPGRIYGGLGDTITFDNGELVARAQGKPDAHINAGGDLRIDGRAIAVTPAQRDLLQRYYGEAQEARTEGIAITKAGAKLGKHAIGEAIDSVFSGKSDKTDQALDAQSKPMETAFGRFCGNIRQLRTTQEQIAAQLPTFEPYSAFEGKVRCQASRSASHDAGSGTTVAATTMPAIGPTIDHALDEASAELHKKNITISDDKPGLPDAEITPQGDFLIEGKPIATTPAQRAMLLDYRQQIVEIGAQGIAIGRQGAALGMKAAGEALAAAFSGQSEHDIEQRIEAQADGIRQAASKICDRLPALMTEQQKLATTLPAFKPYATMTQDDIDDCRVDALHDDGSDRAETRHEIRERIRSRIRSGIQTATQGAGMASRGTTGAESGNKGENGTQH